MLTPPHSVLTSEARQRLKAIEEFSDLGSGFNISLRDLDIRGAGNLLGGEQSGFIAEIGFEMYQKILDEAISELRIENEEFKISESINPQSAIRNSQYVKDCVIDTDLEILIPDFYIENITERLSLYKELDDVEEENKLLAFEENLKDRFGAVPKEVKELMNTIRLRWIAKELGFEKIILRNNKLIGHFVGNQNSEFYKSEIFNQLIQYVQHHPRECSMKENKSKLLLTFENVKNIDEANKVLKTV